MISYCEFASPLGKLLLVAGEDGLRGLYFDEHRHFKDKEDNWRHNPAQSCLSQTMRQLEEFFAGTRTVFDLPLDLQGTPFQQEVWKELMTISYGSTVSYGQHAQRVGRSKAARAVGAAIGRNPVSIVVPCHRVLGANGDVTGYAGGLERKRALLAFEARQQLPLALGEENQLTRRSANG